MNTISSLTGANFRTYNILLQPATAHQLNRLEITALLHHLGDVSESPTGDLAFRRNGHTHVARCVAEDPALSAEALTDLRRFLVTSETPRSSAVAPGPDLLLIIDHAEARVLQIEMENSVPARLRTLGTTEDEPPSATEESPSAATTFDSANFFEPVAAALKPGGRILVLGGGTGMRSGMDQFMSWLQLHYPETAARIIDVVSVDVRRLTEVQLLTKIRACYRSALS